MSRLRAAIRATRPAHALKNAPILAGLVFGHRTADGAAVRAVALTFAAFWLVASAGYLINDVVDREVDAGHPTRGSRPIASGALSVRAALSLAVVLALAAAGLGLLVPPRAAACVAAYGALTLAYTFVLRRVALAGVLAVAGGFVLRAASGALAAGVAPSPWLLGLVGVLAAGFAVAKRENDARRRGAASRALVRTTDALLAATAMGYLAWGLVPDTVRLHGTRGLPWTAIPVAAALARFRARLRASRDGSGPAELVAGDPWLVGLALAWAAAVAVVLHVGGR